jgi:uncharacterized protein with HEPN domain
MRRESSDATDRQRLEHMLRAAQDAVTISTGRRRDELDQDILLQHALVHCVQLIGEAAARVTDAGRARAPEIPWSRMAGMRHILVHAYFKIDYDAVWRAVTEHVPLIADALKQALAAWPPPSQ